MKANYHTHTARCMHADGPDEAYAGAALAAGFDVLGFSDHAPWPFANGYTSTIRMGCGLLEDYIASVHSLRERYDGQLKIRLGLESEYFPRYRDHLLRMRDEGITYLILGHHYCDSEEDNPYIGLECVSDEGVMRYAETCCAAMRTGLFLYLAHPDLFMRHRTAEQFSTACERATDMICQCASEEHLPIEYNLYGLSLQLQGKDRGYPSGPFWQRAVRWKNDVILGVDAHRPALLADPELWNLGTANVTAAGYHLIDNLEDRFEEE